MLGISDRANNLGESVTIKMARIAGDLKEQGKDVISLSLGEPDFDVPQVIKSSAKQAIDENYSHYTPVPGYKDLLKAIQNKFKRDNDLNYDLDQIVVSTGAKHSLMNIMLATVNEGDEVILPAPYWVSYIEMAKFCGGKPVTIQTGIETDFKITPAQLEEALSDKTKVFMFSNPCNPSGSVYSHEELEQLVKVFEKSQCYIISDEIYEYINFEGKTPSLANFASIRDRVITVNGMSKGFSMTGWRIGYIGAPKVIAKACAKIQGQFTSGANAVAQRASITALNEAMSDVESMRETFAKRRDLFLEKLSEIQDLKLNKPTGAFYLFPDVSNYFGRSANGKTVNNVGELCEFILEDSLVATTPGDAFGCPNNIRLSYANSDEQLIEAAKRIKNSLSKLQ